MTTGRPEWTERAYAASVTSRTWNSTPADGWQEARKDREIRAIYDEEMSLGKAPEWAVEIVTRMIRSPLPPCGHYLFPEPVLQVCRAIRDKSCPDFVFGCYTADPKRKVLMSCYVYCVDAWLNDAPPEAAKAELALRDGMGKDWPRIVDAVYSVLGKPAAQKIMLARRLVHRLRWWIKTLTWPGDGRNRFLLDAYLGDVRGSDTDWGDFSGAPFGDPYFTEIELPDIEVLADGIRASVPGGDELLTRIESTWLCAPKAFRYVEKLILEIGSVGGELPAGEDEAFLQCEDTYPDVGSCRAWYGEFMASLDGWLEGRASALSELGDIAPVKHWLARILRHKLRLYAQHDNLGKLVGALPGGRSGRKII